MGLVHPATPLTERAILQLYGRKRSITSDVAEALIQDVERLNFTLGKIAEIVGPQLMVRTLKERADKFNKIRAFIYNE